MTALVRRLPSTVLALVVGVLLMLAAIQLGVSLAGADSGAPIVVDAGAAMDASPTVDATPYRELYVPAQLAAPAADPARTVDLEDPLSLAMEAYRGITTGNWFLAAGSALALVVLGVRWLLAKKWPDAMGRDAWAIAIVAGVAGVAAVAHAWIAGVDVDALTLVGALRVWAAAVWQYVTAKKLLGAVLATPKVA